MSEISPTSAMLEGGWRRAIAGHPLNKHQQRTEETRRGLLAAARQIFARDGFEACRIEDIAAAAGHTRGAFYANFKAKEELFFALLYEEAEKHSRQIRAALRGCETVGERWAAVREHFVNCMADRNWGMLMLEFKLFAVRHPRLRLKLASTHRRIRASMKLDDIQELLGLDKRNFEPTRSVLEGLLTGLFLQHAYDPESLSEQQAAHYLGELFNFLLRAKMPKG